MCCVNAKRWMSDETFEEEKTISPDHMTQLNHSFSHTVRAVQTEIKALDNK